MSYYSPEQIAFRRQKKAAMWGMTVEQLDNRDQRTANYYQVLANELQRMGCTGIRVGPREVSYAQPPKKYPPHLEQWKGIHIDWIMAAEIALKKRGIMKPM